MSYLLAPKTAANYDELFKALLALTPSSKTAIQAEITWAKRVLKKSNRIIWWLRWYRIALADFLVYNHRTATDETLTEEQVTQLRDLAMKYWQEGEAKSGKSNLFGNIKAHFNPSTDPDWKYHHGFFEHTYALHYAPIQSYEPGFKTIDDVSRALYRFELEYQEQIKGTLTPQSEDSIFLDCGGGWAWWLLPRASCDSEAQAMGHCGNSPDADRTDMSILSLRQKKKVGNKDVWEPHLTFILHRLSDAVDSGTLGEMKGKGNQKPVPRYFPYIVRLLSDQRIKGIDGGGYKPENNFSPKDLTDEQRAEVEEANPAALMTLRQYYRANGFDDVVAARVAAKLNISNEHTYDGFIVKSWATFAQFLQDCADREAKDVQHFLDDGNLSFFAEYGLDHIEDDNSSIWKGLAAQIFLEFGVEIDPNAEDYPQAVKKALDGIKADGDSELRQILEEGFDEARAAKMSERRRTYRDENGLQELLNEAIDNSTSDSPTTLSYEGPGISQVVDLDYALELAFDNSELGDVEKPYVSVDLEIDADAYEAYLEQHLNPDAAKQRMLEQRGQERLFKRPETDEEATENGIKISRLLLPKTSAQDYESMFAQLVKLAPDTKNYIEGEIEWAKRVLKKSNRITWWLRWARLALVLGMIRSKSAYDPATIESLKQYQQKIMGEMSKGGVAVPSINSSYLNTLKPRLEHFYSLAVPGIQNADPGYELPEKFIDELGQFEEKYIEQAQGTITPQTEDSIYINFSDGWAWWFLPRASCSTEAKAMGHCGNAPAGHRKDRAILSLRQKKKIGKEERWEPHLTFILHTDPPGSDQGELGEMKGKGNQKPVERYHPYIIKLLEDNRIKGVVGGGYKPENNFQFSDLTPEQQAAVRKANPEAFFTFDEYMEKKGLSLYDIADKLGITQQVIYPQGEDAEPGLVIRAWYDLDEFTRDCGDDEARQLAACVNGDMSVFVDSLLRYVKSYEAYQGLARLINKEFDLDEPLDLESPKLAKEVRDEIASFDDDGESELRKVLEAAFLAGNEYRDIDIPFSEFLKSEAVWSAENGEGNTGKVYVDGKNRVYQYLPAREAIEMSMDEGLVESLEDEGFDRPFMGGLRFREKLEDSRAAEAIIEARTPQGDRPSPRYLEEKGQERLFKRPDTDEEAKANGIHVSYLLQPKKALTVSDTGNAYMALSGDKVVDEVTIGDYEVFVLKSGIVPGLHLLGMQRIGSDAFDLSQQLTKQPNTRGTGSIADLKQTIEGWLQKYGQLVIGSHNPEKARQYERLAKRLGFKVDTKTIAGLEMPVIEKTASKTAYVTPGKGELTVAIDNGQRPRVTISVELGIPNFTRFAITVPIEMFQPDSPEIDQYARQAFEVLLQDISAFLIVMKYPEEMIAEALSNAEVAFLSLDAKHATDARMPDADEGLRMYEIGFALPEEFINQTRERVVTASAVRRLPEVRTIELLPLDALTPPGTPDETIQFHLDQSTRNTPRAFTVQVIESPVPAGTKARDWEQRRVLEQVA